MEEWTQVFGNLKQSLNRIRIRARQKGLLLQGVMPYDRRKYLQRAVREGEKWRTLYRLNATRLKQKRIS